MALYIGNTCPVCGEKFKDGDDVVVCPDCGTPYHRECWQKTGVCLYQAEHAAGFEWHPEPVEDSADAQDAVCPNCGTHNAPGAQRCEHCGVPLHQGEPPRSGETATPIYARGPQPRQSYDEQRGREPHLEGYSTGRDGGIYRKEVGPEDPIDGIKVRDWASFVGRSSMYYLMQFFRMSETGRRATVSFSAFLFGPLYFFWRKMWKQGALFFVLETLFSVPTYIYCLHVTGASLLSGADLNWLPTAMNVCYVAGIALKIVMSLFAVYWYKQTAAQRIRAISSRLPEGQDRTTALVLQGGTSVPGILLYFGINAAVAALLFPLMGPNINAMLRLFL